MPKALCEGQVTAVAIAEFDESAAWTNRAASARATRAAKARQVSGRRRFVDPATSEREYTDAEMEFMMAMQEYKRCSGRMFPTLTEVLDVVHGLGYEKMRSANPGEIAQGSGGPK